MQREINILRMTVIDRNEEIEQMKRGRVLEIDRAKEEAFDRAEKRFLENAKIREARYQEEKEALHV
jgi:hypothetical protein